MDAQSVPPLTNEDRANVTGKPKRLGDEGAIVLPIEGRGADVLAEGWKRYRDAGASWDFEKYQPHVTITYDGAGVDMSKVDPFHGVVMFGPERQKPLELDRPRKDEAPSDTEAPKGDGKENTAPPDAPTKPLGVLSQAEQDRAALLRPRIAERLKTQLNSGIDPELIRDAVELVGIYIKAGVRKFRAMVDQIGADMGLTAKDAEPWVRAAYNQARDDMELDGADVADMDDAKAVLAEVKKIRAETSKPEVDAKPEAAEDLARDAAPAVAVPDGRRIEDFGEKIGGARKDVWTGFKERMQEAERLDISAEPLSRSWPEPDYEKLIVSGIDQWAVSFVRAARDMIPRKPGKSWKLRGWADQVGLLRGFDSIYGRAVIFSNGAKVEADAIIFGTGFKHNLSWLAPDIARIIGLGGPALDLFAQTVHPDLPGLALVGQYDLIGPYFPVLELQARFVAGIFAGQITLPGGQAQKKAMADLRAAALPAAMPMHAAAILFARLTGCEPDLKHWPDQERALLFGPLTPISFRLEGPDARVDAVTEMMVAAASLGRITTPTFRPDELALMGVLMEGQAKAA